MDASGRLVSLFPAEGYPRSKAVCRQIRSLGWCEPPVPGGVQAGIDWACGDDMEGICASNGVVGLWA